MSEFKTTRPDTFEIVTADTIAPEGLAATLNHLLNQLSSRKPQINPDRLRELLNDPHIRLFLARRNSEPHTIAGMLALALLNIPSGRKALIEDVVVDERFRNKGIGRQLMEAALREAIRQGAEHVEFTSHPSRRAANALYKKMGFELRTTNVYRRSFSDQSND